MSRRAMAWRVLRLIMWGRLNVYGTKRVLIAYDRDEAGDKAADKLAEQLIALGIECLRVRFPKGMDANSTALKLTPAQHSLGLMLRQAEWMGRPAEESVKAESAPAVPVLPLAAGVDVVEAAHDGSA